MKKVHLLVILFSLRAFTFAQTEDKKIYCVSQIQGIWQMYANYTDANDESFYKLFYVFKGEKKLKVDISENPYDKLTVTVSSYGFANSYWRDSICAMNHLNDSGTVFVQIDENEDLKDCNVNIASIFELRPKSHLNIFSDECNFIDKAPKEVLEVLYKRGKHDKRDYIKEFLDIQVCGIQAEKCFIYDKDQTKTKMYLIKDDIVTIIGEQSGFVKMEYETAKGDTIKGWVKKEDVAFIPIR